MDVSHCFGRGYLETYYPDSFDEAAFLSALLDMYECTKDEYAVIDVTAKLREGTLSREIIENAGVLVFLLRSAEYISSRISDHEILILDIGGGPTVYQHILFSLIAQSIVHTDPVMENRREIELFLRGAPTAYQWDAYFRVLMKFSQKCQSSWFLPTTLLRKHIDSLYRWKEHVRSVIYPRIVACDVFQPSLDVAGSKDVTNVLSQYSQQPISRIVTSNFLLESATDNASQWERGFDTLTEHVSPNGFLSMLAIRNAKWYQSGEHRVSAFPVTESILRDAFEKRSFEICRMVVLDGNDEEQFGYDGMLFVLARKK